MKKTIAVLILSLCIAAVSIPAGALTLSLNPSTQIVNPGDDVFFDLVVSGLTGGGPDSLGAFEVNILYDDALFGFSSATFGGSLGNPDDFVETDLWVDDFVPGNLYFYEISFLEESELDQIQKADFTLATLQFAGVGIGHGNFEMDYVVLTDGAGYSFDAADLLLENASVIVTPEPCTMLLVGLGILGIAGARRKF